MELRELLSKYGFPGDEIPIVRGSALKVLESTSTDPQAPEYACIHELMAAVDSYIPTPERAIDKPFLMPIEDVFGIKGRGTVVTGRVERGQVKTGEEIEIIGMARDTRKVVVTGVEMFRKTLDLGPGRATTSGCLLRGIEREDVERGQVLAKPGSINPHTKFLATVYVLSKEEGRAAHAVLQRLSAPVLLSDHRRDRLGGVGRGDRDGDARGQHDLDGDDDYEGGHGRRPALRHPRRRPHRRRRRRHQDPGVEPDAKTENSHSPEGVRPQDPRSVGDADRRHGGAHGRAGRRPVPLPTQNRVVLRLRGRRSSTRIRASSSRFGRISA